MADVEVTGLKEFRAALRGVRSEWPDELRAVHARIADLGARASRAYATGMGGIQRKAVSAIGAKSTQTTASVVVLPSRLDAFGAVAYWGAKRHTGWYAKPRYRNSTRQHPVWVGNSWEAAVAGQGPHAINNALAAVLPRILDEYLRMVDELARKPFPEGVSIGSGGATTTAGGGSVASRLADK